MTTNYSRTDLEYEILYNPDFIPVRRGMVSVKTVIDSTGKRHFMRNHASGSYYDLDAQTNLVWTLIDNRQTVTQIVDKATKRKVGLDETYEILLFFAESGALSTTTEEQRERRLRVVSPFRVEVTIIRRSEDFLKWIHRVFGPTLKRPLLWLSFGFIILTSILFAGTFAQVFGNQRYLEIAGPGSYVLGFFFYQFVILMPVIAIHELSHGLALVHYGGKPGEVGTGLLYFGLMFYVDATDSWSLPRGQRIVVMLAGILSTGLIGAALVVIPLLVPVQGFVAQVMLMTAFWCFYTGLWNLAPPFETDGYYALADALNMPHLKPEAYSYLKNSMKRIFRRPAETLEGITAHRKLIYIGYLILSIAFIAFIVYSTLRFAYWMALAAGSYFIRLVFIQNLSSLELVIAIISIFYFLLSVSGYMVVFTTAAKKAAVRSLKFESIGNRELSIFTYLPEETGPALSRSLVSKLRQLGEKYTPSVRVSQNGPLHVATLRLGGTKLAIQQMREHLRKIERAFNSMYQNFLLKHRGILQSSIGIRSQTKNTTTRLLIRLGGELSRSGSKEAAGIVRQVIAKQIRATLYLLNAAFSSVWSMELSPAQEQEFQEALMPSSMAEDLTITDLYGGVEEFKKHMIYGYDSLSALALEERENLAQASAHPEMYHVVYSFEPVKGRLLFLGRTQQIEEEFPAFASLFVNQTWSGYLDNLLSETNLTLSVVGQINALSQDEIRDLSDGEVTSLLRNLRDLGSAKNQFDRVLLSLREDLKATQMVIRKLSGRITNPKVPGLELLQSVLNVNKENLNSLPERFKDFELLTKRLYSGFAEIEILLEPEYARREAVFGKRRRRMLQLYPIFLAWSLAAAFVGLANGVGMVSPYLLIAALLPQAAYGVVYLLNRRSFHRSGRFVSPVFSRIETPLFALVQALFNFLSTADILKPASVAPAPVPKRRSRSLEQKDEIRK